ncbi:MAG TPA: 5-oxoprolinase subunit PxpB [Clostridia bacterium]|nr:5-oxoprolinase subunit PxpB [Clostridia bacterium]
MKCAEWPMTVVQCGDCSRLVVVGHNISPLTNARVHALRRAIEALHPVWLVETVPGYCTLGLVVRPLLVSQGDVEELVSVAARSVMAAGPLQSATVTIPVCYGGAYGPDMEAVCRRSELSEAEVVRRHTASGYECSMLGFLPGFPYLMGLDPQLATPRLAVPRVAVPAGSVGIAGGQTGVYPVSSPGGWNIIGRTPLTLFDPSRKQPSLVQAGDTVCFTSISPLEFEHQRLHEFTHYPQICDVCEPDHSQCEVLEPGMLTTVQDAGRRGLQHMGVPVSGVMDRQALALGNLLVGNDPETAALEITLSGPCLAFRADALVALVGADVDLQVDGNDIPAWTAVLIRAGSVLTIGSPTGAGCRAWLCIAGGIDVPNLLGSRSTLLRGSLGGFEGRALRAGDVLRLFPLTHDARRLEGFSCPAGLRESDSEDMFVPVLPGPQIESLKPDARQVFLETTWAVSAVSDRMGCRLEGPPLDLNGGADVISEAVPEGAVEVASSGLPIIMLSDCQTIGGYVKPFVVASAALGRLAQRRPDDSVRFRVCSLDEACTMLEKQLSARERLAGLQAEWRQRRLGGTLHMTVNGLSHAVEWQDVTPLEVDDERDG